MKYKLLRYGLLSLLVMLFCGNAYNNQDGTLLTAEEQVEGTAVEFGVAVDSDGKTVRVAADDASSIATISGKYHSDHGMTGLKTVVAVPGPVKIIIGTCTYSGNTITVTNSNGDKVIEHPITDEQDAGRIITAMLLN